MFPSRDPSFRRVVVKTRCYYGGFKLGDSNGVFTLAGTKTGTGTGNIWII